MTYVGWIQFTNEETIGKIIVETGIFLKDRQPDGSYNCDIEDDGFERLDKYWGEAIWGLTHYEDRPR